MKHICFLCIQFFPLGFTRNNILLLGSSKFSFFSLLPCNKILQLFYQYNISYKFSLPLVFIVYRHVWIIMYFSSWWIEFCYTFICLLGPFEKSVKNSLFSVRHFKVLDMRSNYNLCITYHLVVYTGIISIYFETNGFQILHQFLVE